MAGSKVVEVVVRGRAGAGKTTVARLIEAALKNAGFTFVDVVDDSPGFGSGHPLHSPDFQEQRVAAVRDSARIRIVTQQAPRSGLHGE